jgi:predicted PurR-regulated permease PerM
MEIDDKLLRRINRQLRGIRIMLTLFFLMLVAMLAIVGFIAYKVVTFTHDVNNKITNIENTTSQKIDVKSQLCQDATGIVAQQLCQ